MLTITAPSRITASTVGTHSEEPEWISGIASSVGVGTSSSRHLTMSDLVISLSLPIFESDVGHARFSCAKNSSRSPARVWQDMYMLEKSEQSLFTDDNWCFAIDFSRRGGRLKKLWTRKIVSFDWVLKSLQSDLLHRGQARSTEFACKVYTDVALQLWWVLVQD